MKEIIDVATKEEIRFTNTDLPILIHGKEHSGASLLSITIAAEFHEAGNKLCIYTAYPMAKDEFLQQIKNPETVFFLENEKDIEQALSFQTIIIKSGDAGLFASIISKGSFVDDRIIFIKNIETINVAISELVAHHPFIVSGDLEANPTQKEFSNFTYNTKILFDSLSEEAIPPLEKYQAFLRSNFTSRIITIKV